LVERRLDPLPLLLLLVADEKRLRGEEPLQRQYEGGSRGGKEHGRYEQQRGR
jgi:hypothetical protein